MQTFQGHPLHGQLGACFVVYTVVFLVIHVSSKTEIRDLDSELLIQPTGRTTAVTGVAAAQEFTATLRVHRLEHATPAADSRQSVTAGLH